MRLFIAAEPGAELTEELLRIGRGVSRRPA